MYFLIRIKSNMKYLTTNIIKHTYLHTAIHNRSVKSKVNNLRCIFIYFIWLLLKNIKLSCKRHFEYYGH